MWAAMRSLARGGPGELESETAAGETLCEDWQRARFEVLNEWFAQPGAVSFGDNDETQRVISEVQNDGTAGAEGRNGGPHCDANQHLRVGRRRKKTIGRQFGGNDCESRLVHDTREPEQDTLGKRQSEKWIALTNMARHPRANVPVSLSLFRVKPQKFPPEQPIPQSVLPVSFEYRQGRNRR